MVAGTGGAAVWTVDDFIYVRQQPGYPKVRGNFDLRFRDSGAPGAVEEQKQPFYGSGRSRLLFLRKIYAARLLLFGAADVFLLSFFFAVSLFSLKIETADLLIQFILPMNVTCGICFGTLESKKHMSLFSSLTLCLFWTAAWFLLVSSDGLYERITMPVWMGVLLFSFFFLSWSVWRLWKKCQNYYEVCET